MSEQNNKEEILNVIWKACDTFRGVIDPGQYKDYILTMLFIKYISDVHKSRIQFHSKKYDGDQTRIDRAMSRERFNLSDDCTFDYLYKHRNADNIGELINTTLAKIEDENKAKLHNVFRNIDYNSEAQLGQTKERNKRLKNLIDGFSDFLLILSTSSI